MNVRIGNSCFIVANVEKKTTCSTVISQFALPHLTIWLWSILLSLIFLFSDCLDLRATVLVCQLLIYSRPTTLLIFDDLLLFSYQSRISGVLRVINKLSTSYTINVYTASQSSCHCFFCLSVVQIKKTKTFSWFAYNCCTFQTNVRCFPSNAICLTQWANVSVGNAKVKYNKLELTGLLRSCCWL